MLELKARKLVWGSAEMPKSLLCPCLTHIGHRSAGDTHICIARWNTHTHTHIYKYILGHSWNTLETRSWYSEVKIWNERQKMDFNYPAKFEPLIKLLKSNQGSTGVPFWPMHLSWFVWMHLYASPPMIFFFFDAAQFGPK